MVVIVLEKCPIALRGDLTKWLQEINTGVYVGQLSARVREKLWKRVCAESKHGRATMVYSARNEQHMDFRVHNTSWEPIDFDGLKLMLRPSATRLREKGSAKTGFSSVSKRRYGQRGNSSSKRLKEPEIYIVVDIETTGLDPESDEIVEIGALKVVDGVVQETLSHVVRCNKAITREITELTGISQSDVEDGCDLNMAMESFLRFVRMHPLVMHNAAFDMEFIDGALEQLDIDSLENQCLDTLTIARSLNLGLTRYRLDDLCRYFGIEREGQHRAIPDCFATKDAFTKLVEFAE